MARFSRLGWFGKFLFVSLAATLALTLSLMTYATAEFFIMRKYIPGLRVLAAGEVSFPAQACLSGEVLTFDGSNVICVPDLNSDTVPGAACASGEVLTWNGSAFACVGDQIGSSLTAPSSCPAGQALNWDGSNWTCVDTIDNATNAANALPTPATCASGEASFWTGSAFTCVDTITNADFAASSTVEVPSGSIVAFDAGSCPSGWSTLADSTGRFLVGTGGGFTGTGGSTSVTLGLANLPAHTHTGTTNADGVHTHTASTGSDSHTHSASTNSTGAHYHAFDIHKNASLGNNTGVPAYQSGTGYVDNQHGTTTTGAHSHTVTVNSDAHSHSVTNNNAASHTHGFTTGSTGSGTAITVTPPFKAVIFCVKT